MKTPRNMEQLQSTSLDVFPTVKKVMSQVRSASDGMTYQRTRTLHYDEGIAFLIARKDEFFGLVSVCLKNCVKSHHSELLKDILTLLATQGWEKSTTDFADAVFMHLSDRFVVPLDKAGVDLSMLQEEWNDLVDYARRYLNLVQVPSRVNWWKLFNASISTSWTNIFALIELLFCVLLGYKSIEKAFRHSKQSTP